MNTEMDESKLTAYALDDPSLSDAERADIERRIADDPAAKASIEETRALGQLLTTRLAAEAPPVVVPSVAASLQPKKSNARRWFVSIASLAAAMLVGAIASQQFGLGQAKVKLLAEANSEKTKLLIVDHSESLSESTGDKVVVVQTTQATPQSKLAPMVKGGVAPGGGGFSGGGQGGFGGGRSGGFGGGQGGGGFGGGQGGFGGHAPANGFSGRPTGPLPQPTPISPQPDGLKPSLSPDLPADPSKADSREYEEARKNSILRAKSTSEPAKPAGEERFSQRGELDHDALSGERFRQLVENPFTRVEGMNAVSTFGVDVDTASYSIVRNFLNHNTLPHPDAVRLEEMVNYFPYRDAAPEGNDPFAVRVEMADCPWQPKHRLVRVALKAKPIDNSKRPPSNLVFLIDVSGSMDAPNRLPLVKASMKLLVDQLGENDRVALVVYAGTTGLVLDSTNASQKDVILKALDNLGAGGSTNGGAGIQQAYDVAVRNFIPKGTNRVILCTDGDWNVGTTSTEALIKLIEEKRKTGVFLSVFGFGMGNLRDEMMVQLAGKGNGNYAYIDTISEAKKALVEQLSGTLVTVAKDVKIQIEFNPAKVAAYRLLGYEKRKLATQDFHDDKKDAGEMGAGHVVTALYELVPTGIVAEPKVDGLRYQPATPEKPKANVDDKVATEAFVLKLRHKQPDSDVSTLREIPVGDVAKSYDKATEDFQFASSVAAFAMLLKESPYKGIATYALVEELAAGSMTHDPGAYRAEFLQLVKKAKQLANKP